MTQLEALRTILAAARELDDDAPFRKELLNQEECRREWRKGILAACQFGMIWQRRLEQEKGV